MEGKLKKILIILLMLNFVTISKADTVSDMNAVIEVMQEWLIVKPQQMMLKMTEPTFVDQILGSKFTKAKTVIKEISLQILWVMIIIGILMKAMDYERFDYFSIASEFVKGIALTAAIRYSDKIYEAFTSIADSLVSAVGVDAPSSSGQGFYIAEGTQFLVAGIMGVISIICMLAISIITFIFISSLLVRLFKIIIYQIMIPIYLSLAVNSKTSDLTKNNLFSYFIVIMEIAFYFVIIKVISTIPDILNVWFLDGKSMSSLGAWEQLGLVIGKGLLYALVLFGLYKGMEKLMDKLQLS